MGELHLEVLVDRMKREFRVEANVGKPQVAYRETIRRRVEKAEYTHKKQTGGSGQFGRVVIDIEPTGAAVTAGTSSSTPSPRAHPAGVHPGSRRGHPGANGVRRDRWVPAGRCQGDPRDGAYHDVDSSELAFKIAGSMAFKEAAWRRPGAL